jgi:translation initiation factor RLI1
MKKTALLLTLALAASLHAAEPLEQQFENPPDWKAILKYFRGNELQSFFTKMLEDKMKALIKV